MGQDSFHSFDPRQPAISCPTSDILSNGELTLESTVIADERPYKSPAYSVLRSHPEHRLTGPILQVRHQLGLFRRLRRPKIFLHRQRRSRAFFDRAINEAAPAHCPVGVCEEDVALARSEVLQAFGDEAGGGEEPVETSLVDGMGRSDIYDSLLFTLTMRPLRTRRLPSCGRPEKLLVIVMEGYNEQ